MTVGTSEEHYQQLLAEHYDWLFGGREHQLDRHRQWFREQGLVPSGSGRALDLGCGSGFQSIPLAELGYSVTAVDESRPMLERLQSEIGDRPVSVHHANLVDFCAEDRFELIICMGDTLPHLSSHEEVEGLLTRASTWLETGGRLILSFRELAEDYGPSGKHLLVRSDPTRLAICHLIQPDDRHVLVTDLIADARGGSWQLSSSTYSKLRLDAASIGAWLEGTGRLRVRSEPWSGQTVVWGDRE